MSAQEGDATQREAPKPITTLAFQVGWNDDGVLTMALAGALPPVALAAMLNKLAGDVTRGLSFDQEPKSKIVPIRAIPGMVGPHANRLNGMGQ